jgi:H+/Cl- antiporter ClcA
MPSLIEIANKKKDQWMESFHFRLARPDALVQLAALGLLTGLIAGGVIVIFRLLVEQTQDYLLPGNGPENYEALDENIRFLFPIISGVILALLFYTSAKGLRVLGIARVMERMAYHQGYLTVREFVLQFLGAGIAIIGGHSVGREGPHVHLGAASGSLFGQSLKLPNNSIRTLVASGAAAGIAASFNTPLAGVIFALEVIMMEYTLVSFVPVMLAAVAATGLSNFLLGSEPAFIIPLLETVSIKELPIFVLLGVVAGSMAALFNQLLMTVSGKTQGLEIWWRIMAAGFLVAVIGYFQPQVLGIGYDTVNETLQGNITLFVLLALTFAKLIATSISIGLGIPGGMVGPAFFIGATLGATIGYLASSLFGIDSTHIGFYALLGMGAMLGASLQAPLAALTAIMELTYNPGIIMPGMLTIVIAQLTASEVFNKKSLFITMLRSNGLDYDINPVMQVLRGIGVASILDDKVVRIHSQMTDAEAKQLMADTENINWIMLNDSKGDLKTLMPITELAKYLQTYQQEEGLEEADAKLDLLEIPANRLQLSPISLQANLQQAHQKFEQGAEALYVVFNEEQAETSSRIYGVITKIMVEASYKN